MAFGSSNFTSTSVVFAICGTLFLGACTQTGSSVETALKPQSTSQQTTSNSGQVTANALTSESPAQTSPGLAEVQPSITAETQTAAIDTRNSMAFLPVEGAPQSAVTTLSKSLRSNAQTQGLSLIGPSQSGAAFRVKGYFSALNDGAGTLLVYVWDVLDASGKRVHRINGQERSGTSKSDPWQAITEVELGRVANRTTQSLKSWIDTRKS